MRIAACAACGRDFETTATNAKLCSAYCRAEWVNRRRRERYASDPKNREKRLASGSAVYENPTSWAKKLARMKLYKRKWRALRAEQVPPRKCVVCGNVCPKVQPSNDGRGPKPKFCSEGCQEALARERKREYMRRRYAAKKLATTQASLTATRQE